jgi:magnesium chelatase subunit D
MAVTKGAVLSLLLESYRRRDRVALAIFCGSGAEVRLTPTRSVDVARRLLTDLPTGGRSPLAHGLTLASQELAKLRQRDPASHLMLVLVSDGRANGASPASTDPRTQALQIAAGIFRQDVPSLALDSEQGPVLLGQMRSLAQALGATYRRLDQLQGAEIAGLIKHQRNLST